MKKPKQCPECGGDILFYADITPETILPRKFTRDMIPETYHPWAGVCTYFAHRIEPVDQTDEERLEQVRNLRNEYEFDEALSICDSIIADDSYDGKAHWFCALTRQKICGGHTPYSKLFFFEVPNTDRLSDDENFKQAIEWTYDSTTKSTYIQRAKEIDALRDRIKALQQQHANQANCQVYICATPEMEPMARELEKVLKDQQVVTFCNYATTDEAESCLSRNDAKVLVALADTANTLSHESMKNQWFSFGKKWGGSNDYRMLAVGPSAIGALNSMFSVSTPIDCANAGWTDEVLKIVRTIYQATTVEKTVIITDSHVQENIDHGFECFMKRDFKNAMLSAEKVLQEQDSHIPANYMKAFYQACVENTSHRDALKNFFAKHSQTVLSAEDVKLMKNMFLVSAYQLMSYEREMLELVLRSEDTPANICAFVDTLCPKLIAKRENREFLTPALVETYSKLANKCNIPKTCFALLSSVRTNPDSPIPQNKFYLTTKAENFRDEYVIPVGKVINMMSDPELRKKFIPAYRNELQKYEIELQKNQ